MLAGPGSVSVDDDLVTLPGGERVTLYYGLCVQCDEDGTIELDVRFVEEVEEADDRVLVEVRVEIECVPDCVDPA